MRNRYYFFCLLFISFFTFSLNVMAQDQTMNNPPVEENSAIKNTDGPVVEIKTTMGDIIVKLYNDTPLHRDNFLKLVKDGYYDGVLFHRVINNFMVQTGDPDSKNAMPGAVLGSGSPNYTIEAEIDYPKHYHKYGALAAARTGDNVNPEKRSSGSQFYIVTGRKVSSAQLQNITQQSVMPQRQQLFMKLAKEHSAEIEALQAAGDQEGLAKLQQQIIDQVEKEIPAPTLSDKMIEDYTTVGGAPHLDGQYTVFGEVLEGMDVVEKIQNAETDRNDRPLEDIKVISVKVLKD